MSRPTGSKPDPLHDLDARIKAARDRHDQATGDGASARSRDLGAGMRISVEIVAAIGVGTGIGIALDHWLGTAPWLLIVFFIVGTAAAFLNVYRVSMELDRQRQRRRQQEERAGDGHHGGAA